MSEGLVLAERHPAYERFEGRRDSRLLITCEHASQRMPRGFRWPDEDRRLVDTHWAYDLGAAELARALAAELEAPALLSRFSRLLADPNRPEDSPTLFRTEAEGEPVILNTSLSQQERERRLSRLHRPYHSAVDRAVVRSPASILFSVHTFTPLYEGRRRSLEIGVLYDRDEALAAQLAEALAARGHRVAPNEPYSGKEGLMYAVDRHARAHQRRSVEIEVRQDLATDPLFRKQLAAELAAFFAALT